jgi:hypothetical protein
MEAKIRNKQLEFTQAKHHPELICMSMKGCFDGVSTGKDLAGMPAWGKICTANHTAILLQPAGSHSPFKLRIKA